MEKKIKDILKGLGADICGIANIDRFGDAPSGFHPCDIYEGCRSVVVFAKRMPSGLAHVSPRIVYKKANDTTLEELDRITLMASIEIEKTGATAVPMPSDTPYEYWDSENTEGRGVMSMRHAALLAGIGSMGKNTLIANKDFGNMINLGAVLTDLNLKSDDFAGNICIENCSLCLDNCPVKALDGRTANQKLCRANTYSNNSRGFSVCNCNKCRLICPRAFGKK